MRNITRLLSLATLVFAVIACFSTPVQAENDDLDSLFDALREADDTSYEVIESKIWEEWSKSGSPAMDLLLQRGREALTNGDTDAAIDHFTALIDHAPDFAEGYNARATAYFQAELYGPSIEDIRQTLARNPRHFGALSGLAMIFEELGRGEGALAVYLEIRQIHPQRPGLDDAIKRLELEIEGLDL